MQNWAFFVRKYKIISISDSTINRKEIEKKSFKKSKIKQIKNKNNRIKYMKTIALLSHMMNLQKQKNKTKQKKPVCSE